MTRIKRGVTTRAKHKRILENAKGSYGRRKNTIRIARQAVEKAGQYAYRDRKVKKRSFRALWIQRINAAVRAEANRIARLAADGSRYLKPETFAIDWVRLRDGRLFEGDGSRVEQWYGYGAELLAVADGTVVYVRDGMPEETPLADAAGRDFQFTRSLFVRMADRNQVGLTICRPGRPRACCASSRRTG